MNEQISFTSCSENTEIAAWDFGDGNSAEGNTVTHSYSQIGTYAVKITAFSKKKKKSDETAISITVKTGGTSSAPNTWTKRTDFGGTARAYAVGFSIGSKGYVGTGDNLWDGPYKDFWEYDPTANTWTQKSDFVSPRRYAVGFSIGNKGYAGTGTNENFTNTKDFWEYDPFNNTWTKKADFGGTARSGAAGFTIAGKGYVGTGNSTTLEKDFWEYDPAGDTWIQKSDFAGAARSTAVSFTIGNKGYIGTGMGGNYNYLKDFWEYDTATDTWVQRSDFGGTERARAVGFSVNGKGYIGTGERNNSGTAYTMLDFWEYNPATNQWKFKNNFNGVAESARFGAVGFAIGSKGYVGTGVLGNTLKDFWEYTP